MSKIKELDEIAQGVADVTMELMYDSVDWQLSDFPQDGDEYSDIRSYVMNKAIEKMVRELEFRRLNTGDYKQNTKPVG